MDWHGAVREGRLGLQRLDSGPGRMKNLNGPLGCVNVKVFNVQCESKKSEYSLQSEGPERVCSSKTVFLLKVLIIELCFQVESTFTALLISNSFLF